MNVKDYLLQIDLLRLGTFPTWELLQASHLRLDHRQRRMLLLLGLHHRRDLLRMRRLRALHMATSRTSCGDIDF